MTLRDQFEKETREELPLLKNYEYDHEEYYSDTANYFTEYSKWLETKLQNTSSMVCNQSFKEHGQDRQ